MVQKISLSNQFSLSQRAIENLSGSVKEITYLPCGNFLAVLFEGTLEILNIPNQSTKRIANHAKNFNCLAFSSKSNLLAIVCEDSSIRLLNIQEFTEDYSLKGHEGPVYCISCCPKGEFLASGSFDCSIKIWNIKTRKLEFSLQGHSKSVRYLSYSSDSSYLASFSLDQLVKIWNLIEKKVEFTLHEYYQEVNSLKFSPLNHILAINTKHKNIRVWDIKQRKVKFVYYRHAKEVNCLSFSPNGFFLGTASSDRTVVIFNMLTMAEEFCFRGHSSRVTSLAFSINSKYFASGSAKGCIRVCNIEGEREEFLVYDHSERLTSFALSLDGKELAKGSNDKKVRVIQLNNKAQEKSLKLHSNQLMALKYSNDNQLLEIDSQQESIKIWNIKTNSVVFQKKLRTSPKYLFYSTENSYLSLCFSYNSLKKLKTSELLEEISFDSFPGKVFCFSCSSTALYMASSSGFTKLLSRDMSSQNLQKLKTDFLITNCLAYSFDGVYMALGPTGQIWNIQENQKHSDLSDIMSDIVCLTFSPDAHLLAIGCKMNIVTVYNIHAHRIEFSFDSFSKKLEFLEYSSDGKSLITGSCTDGLRFWKIDEKKESLIKSCSTVGKFPTFSSKHQFLASVSRCNFVRLRSLDEKSKDFSFGSSGNRFKSLTFSPDDDFLACGLEGSGIVIFNMKSKKREFDLNGGATGVYSLAFNDDGSCLAAGYQDSVIRIWNFKERKEELSLHGHLFGVICLKYSFNMKFLVSASEDKTFKVWDMEKRAECFSIGPQLKAIEYLSCCNSTLVIIGSKCNMIQVWNYQLKQEINELSAALSPANFSCLSSNGKYVASAHKNDSVKVWSTKSLKEVFRFYPLACSFFFMSLIHLSFTPDGRYLWSVSENKVSRINFKNHLISALDKDLNETIDQRLELNSLYEKAKILKKLKNYQNDLKSLKKFEKILSTVFSQLIIDYIHIKDDSKAKTIADYLLKFSELGFNLKYLTPSVMNLISRYQKGLKKSIPLSCYNELILEFLITFSYKNLTQTYLKKSKEILKIVNFSRIDSKTFPIFREELYDLHRIHFVNRNDFQIQYYSAQYFLRRVLIKKYIFNNSIKKSQKNQLHIDFEKEAKSYEFPIEYRKRSKNFCEFLGYFKNNDEFSLVFNYKLISFQGILKTAELKKSLKSVGSGKKSRVLESVFRYISEENSLEFCKPSYCFINNGFQIIIENIVAHSKENEKFYGERRIFDEISKLESRAVIIFQFGDLEKSENLFECFQVGKLNCEFRYILKQMKTNKSSSRES